MYDLEWIPGTLEVRLVGVYDREQGYRCYRSVRDFLMGELVSSNRGRWFYAHAGGVADLQFVLRELKDINDETGGYYQVNAGFSGSSAVICKVKRLKNCWTFVDSYFLLREKLAKIATWIGRKKGGPFEEFDPDEEGISDEEFEHRLRKVKNWYATIDLQSLRDYNESDCTILYDAIDAFENTVLELGGQLQPTIASCALQLFRRKYLKQDIHTNGAVNHYAEQAYVASRVENIQRHVYNAKYYDVNSSFPYSMTFPCPGECIGSSNRIPDNEDAIFIADCFVEVPDVVLPPLPLRMDERIFFPVGGWRGWFTSVDLRLLEREGGTIHKVYEVIKFAPFHDLADYAKDIYKRREFTDEDGFERVALKYLLNSLYGKFSEGEMKNSLLFNPDETPISLEDRKRLRMEELFPGVWMKEREVYVPHRHVPLSAHITAIARRTLYDCLSYCRDFHYCDTDGFSSSEDLSTDTDLGMLKLEKIVVEGDFVAPKFYRMAAKVLKKDGRWIDKEIIRGKGLSRLTPTRWNSLIEGNAIEFERMSRLRELYRSGSHIPREEVYSKRINIKQIYEPGFDAKKHIIGKRFFYPDGYSRPWTTDELRRIFK